MNVVCLEWADYECRESYYFVAPEGVTEDDFKALCNSLLTEAAQEACRLGGNTWCGIMKEIDNDPTWVGWANIVHVLAHKILPEQGYKPIKLPTVCYSGSHIIRDVEEDDEDGNSLSEEAFNLIVQHNDKVAEQINAHFEETRRKREAELDASCDRGSKWLED